MTMTPLSDNAIAKANAALRIAGLMDAIASGCQMPCDLPIVSAAELRAWAKTIRTAINGLRAPGWRPISEAPEVGQLVAVHAPGAMLADVWPARWTGHNFDAGGGWFEQNEVTGWCSLPPLPPPTGEG